ncbi:ARS binding protein 2-domain-containing protein [Myxozyma melibiosi]|uniref:ARS binding protein 2-domain-containing protein n=1 Tax=Myxozyma melibiosi TaxID=54550 RepID=A0ABR1FFA2_9ASCO
MSTAPAVAARGARSYRQSSTSNSASGSLATAGQGIFHANPELDRRVVSPAVTRANTYDAPFIPSDRTLPTPLSSLSTVSLQELEDAYVQFILYCNPTLSLDANTEDLRRAFRTVPKSDGKAFAITTLLALLKQFETGEIKTWTRLVTELGVERTPEQSAQKAQQYAVRLKVSTYFPFF